MACDLIIPLTGSISGASEASGLTRLAWPVDILLVKASSGGSCLGISGVCAACIGDTIEPSLVALAAPEGVAGNLPIDVLRRGGG